MTLEQFTDSLRNAAPPKLASAPLQALWYDAKGEWKHAHSLVDDLETPDGMAVHAYLHRKEGADSNAAYWYRLAGTDYRRPTLEAEWSALVQSLLAKPD